MKNKEESALTPDSANISDMQTNDDDDERAESRERSRGKRRTAREIANMFEQLKQRHISRKKEWQQEKENLMKKVEMADESKRVLTELKCILENLREELRLEERKRIEMEAAHFAEKRQWEAERDNLLQSLQSTSEKITNGSDMKNLTNKITEQSRQLTEWQNNVLELKKQLLEKENRLLREKRELQLELEKERISWKRKENALNEKIRQLDNKSAQSSASSTSPITTSYSGLDDENKSRSTLDEHRQPDKRNLSTSSTNESSRYNNFQKTVDDALKQIEKISKDLKDIDHPVDKSDLQAGKMSREYSTPSPRPPSINSSYTRGTSEDGPSPNAPWRTKRKTSFQRQNFVDNALLFEDKARLSSASAKSDSPSDIALSLPLINTAQLKMKRSPNPERKVKKISRQGSQVDITVSSPDAPSPKSNERLGNLTMPDNTIPESIGPQDFVETPKDFSHPKPGGTKQQKESDIPDARVSYMNNLPRSKTITVEEKKLSELPKTTSTRSRVASTEKTLSVQDHELTRGRSASPRLPKLHQQLLFKKDDKRAALRKSIESESFTSTDKGKTSDDEPKMLMAHKETVSLAKTKENDTNKNNAAVTNSNVGYTGRTLGNVKTEKFSTNIIPDTSIVSKEKESSSTFPTNTYSENIKKDIFAGDVVPPVVHPKPRVSIHKDQEGNIVRVSPTTAAQDLARKSISPDSTPGSEKQYSIAGRMGRAGRDWIKKKLSFKERRPDEDISTERTLDTPPSVEQLKKRGKNKARQRSSSLLRNRVGFGRSLSTTEDSSESERESRRRESFLRRSKRKGKTTNESVKTGSPAKSRPKKYTRSKTEGSPKEMRNFLAKFKASQGNPNKPSVVKQFELKLLENEVKTLSEENVGTTCSRGEIGSTQGARMNTDKKTNESKRQPEDGYLSGDEGDEDGQFSPLKLGDTPYVPSIIQKRDNSSSPSRVAWRSKAKLGPPVKPKTYYRQSMPDFSSNRHVHFKSPDMDDETNKSQALNSQSGTNVSIGHKKVKGRERKGVLSLVDKFSAKPEDGAGFHGAGKSLQHRPIRRSSTVKPPDATKKSSDENIIPRSHSMSSHDTSYRSKMPLTSSKIEDELIKSTPDNKSWRDRVMFTPDTGEPEPSVKLPTSERVPSRPQRVSAPPGQYDSMVGFWNQPNAAANTSAKPGRMKMMSEEMKRKTDMLEKALSKGPRKPRRYRRADTQPVYSNLSSSDMSDTDDVLNVAFRPFISESRRSDREADRTTGIENYEISEKMHDIIPPVTGKFSKPTRPGRLPSRWAR
uniref:uncharacterized protein LOC120346367 n=1 Tax=Styela clava TaxID=7725 RepID=UPI00193A15F9|nr:uncharacterized protein LOC120346367 [Styela clava]